MVEWTRAALPAARPALYDRRATTTTRRRLTLATIAAITVAASVSLARPFVAFFNGFNQGFERLTSFYSQMTARLVRLTRNYRSSAPILAAAFAAYAFAWMQFPGREFFFVIVIGLLVVPLQIGEHRRLKIPPEPIGSSPARRAILPPS